MAVSFITPLVGQVHQKYSSFFFSFFKWVGGVGGRGVGMEVGILVLLGRGLIYTEI